ncbi:MAG: chemotaxis protein CheX [candidate division Zixibacteria bacterium]|nr:chemotaxis protein CheX [candidate division Zixibacteria bacterium]
MEKISINPFIDAVQEAFDSMVGYPANRIEALPAPSQVHLPDLIGVIGLSGTAQGVVALRFPMTTALAVINAMAGASFDKVDAAVIDGIGELVNIVTGCAKGKLKGHTISISLPTVVSGDICRLSNAKDTVWVEVPFESKLGVFSLVLTLKQVVANRQEVAREGVNSR